MAGNTEGCYDDFTQVGFAVFQQDSNFRLSRVQLYLFGLKSDGAEFKLEIFPASSGGDVEYKVAHDLTLMALAFTFFHEFQHVIFDQENSRPGDPREEELFCDVLARDFMTAKLQAYAKVNGHDYHEVLRKRSMAFGLTALVLHEITPYWGHGGNQQYFSVATRMGAILDNTPLPDNDHFWTLTASLLTGIFRQRHSLIDAPSMSAKALTKYLIERL